MAGYYESILERLLDEKIVSLDDRILVVAGGDTDKNAFQACGFTNVVISNLDERMVGNEFAPYEWAFQDAENLTFEDESFDFCVVHQGLHHCHSPARALLEMHRVARNGVLLFEPYDNLLTRVGIRLKFGQEYEVAAVSANGLRFGGVANSHVPNHVYRWTEREIIKVVRTAAPYGPHRFRFFHQMAFPFEQLKLKKNRAFYYTLRALAPFVSVAAAVFPKQANIFAAVVLKPKLPAEIFPWLSFDGKAIGPNKAWFEAHY